jgi:phosphomethylpyrimidine synthase
MSTQLELARKGQITEAMKCVAQREGVDVHTIRDELAAGRLVIPANTKHLAGNLVPAAVGRSVSVKINANIGCSSVRSSLDGEIEKMKVALDAGADAMMDLSTGGDLDAIREKLLSLCPVMFGIVEKQAKQGVDFFTIHAGLLREHLDLLGNRVCGIVSRQVDDAS